MLPQAKKPFLVTKLKEQQPVYVFEINRDAYAHNIAHNQNVS